MILKLVHSRIRINAWKLNVVLMILYYLQINRKWRISKKYLTLDVVWNSDCDHCSGEQCRRSWIMVLEEISWHWPVILSEPEPSDSVIMTGDVGTHILIYTIRQLITGNNFMLKIVTIEHHSTHVKPRVILVKILLINQNVNTNKKRIIHPEKRENSFI